MELLERVKIQSDGTPRGTKVVDMETGNALPVVEVDWHLDMKGAARATLKTYAQLEYEGPGLLFTICPQCFKELEANKGFVPRSEPSLSREFLIRALEAQLKMHDFMGNCDIGSPSYLDYVKGLKISTGYLLERLRGNLPDPPELVAKSAGYKFDSLL